MSNLAEEFKQKIEENSAAVEQKTEVAEPTNAPVKVMAVEIPVGDPEVIKKRHEESIRKYPEIKVYDDEFVVLSLRRHWIGSLGMIIVTFLLFVVLVSAWILICFTPNKFDISTEMKNNLSLIFAPLTVLVLVMGYIGYTTYHANKFFITNERVIQQIVRGLLDRKTQIINLESAEDISFDQKGILQHILNFGTIRLSTIGDETTYTFHWAKNPAKTAELLGEIAETSRENQPISDELMLEAQKLSAK